MIDVFPLETSRITHRLHRQLKRMCKPWTQFRVVVIFETSFKSSKNSLDISFVATFASWPLPQHEVQPDYNYLES